MATFRIILFGDVTGEIIVDGVDTLKEAVEKADGLPVERMLYMDNWKTQKDLCEEI